MTQPARFPWATALAGAALVLLALSTVAIRADSLIAGQELMRLHERHDTLQRRTRVLRLELDRLWQQGGEPRAPQPSSRAGQPGNGRLRP